jgi:MATE family multidrug resistance protein
MTTSTEVVATAQDYLLWITLAPVLSFLAYIMDGVFFGSTHTADLRKAMIMSALFYFLTAVVLSEAYQNHGLWMSLSLFSLMRALTLLYYYPNIERSVSAIR